MTTATPTQQPQTIVEDIYRNSGGSGAAVLWPRLIGGAIYFIQQRPRFGSECSGSKAIVWPPSWCTALLDFLKF